MRARPLRRARRGLSMRRTEKWDDEQTRCVGRRDRRRAPLIDLENDRALVRPYDAEIGRDGDCQRTITAANREEIDAIAAPHLRQRCRQPRDRYGQGPRRYRKTLR